MERVPVPVVHTTPFTVELVLPRGVLVRLQDRTEGGPIVTIVNWQDDGAYHVAMGDGKTLVVTAHEVKDVVQPEDHQRFIVISGTDWGAQGKVLKRQREPYGLVRMDTANNTRARPVLFDLRRCAKLQEQEREQEQQPQQAPSAAAQGGSSSTSVSVAVAAGHVGRGRGRGRGLVAVGGRGLAPGGGTAGRGRGRGLAAAVGSTSVGEEALVSGKRRRDDDDDSDSSSTSSMERDITDNNRLVDALNAYDEMAAVNMKHVAAVNALAEADTVLATLLNTPLDMQAPLADEINAATAAAEQCLQERVHWRKELTLEEDNVRLVIPLAPTHTAVPACMVCYGKLEKDPNARQYLACFHVFCQGCIRKVIAYTDNGLPECPACRKKIDTSVQMEFGVEGDNLVTGSPRGSPSYSPQPSP